MNTTQETKTEIKTVDADLAFQVFVNGRHIASARTHIGACEMLVLFMSKVGK